MQQPTRNQARLDSSINLGDLDLIRPKDVVLRLLYNPALVLLKLPRRNARLKYLIEFLQ